MRAGVLGAWLACAAAAAGCGGPPRGVVTVELVSASVDGPPPEQGWTLVDEQGAAVALDARGQGSRGALYAARAPAGRYLLRGPGEWAPVGGDIPVPYEPDLPPADRAVGRRGCLYLVAPEGRAAAEARLTASRTGEAADAPLDVEVATGDDARTRVRVRPEDRGLSARVVARFRDGGLSEPTRVKLPADGTPTGLSLRPGATTALDLQVSGGGGAAPAEVEVRTAVDGLEDLASAPLSEAGAAFLPAVPLVGSGATVRRGERLWRLAGEILVSGVVRLWEPEPDAAPGTGRLEVSWEGGPPEDAAKGALLLRGPGTAPYSAAPSPGSSGVLLAASVRAGRWRVLWAGPESGAAGEADVAAGGSAVVRLAPRPACRVSASVAGGVPPGFRYDLRLRRVEGEEVVDGHGFDRRQIAHGDQGMRLPAGRWRLAVASGGREGRPVDLRLDEPGTQSHVQAEPPGAAAGPR